MYAVEIYVRFTQLTRATNLDLHFNCQVNERSLAPQFTIICTKDRRLRFQLPSFRFASYRNSIYTLCELSVSPNNNNNKKKRGRISKPYTFTQYSHFYSLKLVLFSFFFLRFLSFVNFSLRLFQWCSFTL